MRKEGAIQLWITGRAPGSPLPGIAIAPVDLFGSPPYEKQRIRVEASQAAVAFSEATSDQRQMIERLAKMAPDGKLRFQRVATLQQFLDATRSLDANSVTDEALAALWKP